MTDVANHPVHVFVIWEPVIRTDIAPPVTQVLALIPDTRASQYWDPSRLLSAIIRRSQGQESTQVVWDWVALFPPGVRWEESFPKPAFADGPVVRVIDSLREQLKAPARETGS